MTGKLIRIFLVIVGLLAMMISLSFVEGPDNDSAESVPEHAATPNPQIVHVELEPLVTSIPDDELIHYDDFWDSDTHWMAMAELADPLFLLFLWS